MNKDHQDHKKFLEEQIEWCKQQDRILAEIEIKLHEMKKIAEYALKHVLTGLEVEGLNNQLNELKLEIELLEKKLESKVH